MTTGPVLAWLDLDDGADRVVLGNGRNRFCHIAMGKWTGLDADASARPGSNTSIRSCFGMLGCRRYYSSGNLSDLTL